MTSISTISNSIVWDENTILKQGKSFLADKEKELNAYFRIWNTSLSTNPNNDSAKMNAKKFKAVALNAVEEIQALNKAVKDLSEQENANPQSEKNVQLAQIKTISDAALNYFTSLIDHLPYPTYFNQTIDSTWTIGMKLTFSGAVLGVASWLAKKTSPIELPINPLKIGVVSFGILATICLVKGLKVVLENQGFNKIHETRTIYKNALQAETA